MINNLAIQAKVLLLFVFFVYQFKLFVFCVCVTILLRVYCFDSLEGNPFFLPK